VKSRINDDFLTVYRRLPKDVREQARKAYALFRDNPGHPSLSFKRVYPNAPIFSVRINKSYRTVGILADDNELIWFWIGSHADYDRLLSAL